jgi:Predicted signal transduction protein with a C-terminal ATPase domain
MELKGLLLVKLMDAKQAEVVIDLEVLYEVGKIAIDTSDLMRIMGILLDNAIEEAQTTVTKKVSVVILQEDDKTTIIVKNDSSSNVDMSSIWKNGYSTKGKNRGLGLGSYQKILNNYDNAFCETKIENGQFMQILVVS